MPIYHWTCFRRRPCRHAGATACRGTFACHPVSATRLASVDTAVRRYLPLLRKAAARIETQYSQVFA